MYPFQILTEMDEHFEPSNHAVLVLLQQQVAFLNLRRHQLLVEVALCTKAAAGDVVKSPAYDTTQSTYTMSYVAQKLTSSMTF